jgi:hypothetical protein
MRVVPLAGLLFAQHIPPQPRNGLWALLLLIAYAAWAILTYAASEPD